MSVITPQLERSWTQVSDLLKIQNEQDYDLAVERLNSLIDEVGTDEHHPLNSLLDSSSLRGHSALLFMPGRNNTIPCPGLGEGNCCNSSWRSIIWPSRIYPTWDPKG